LGEQPAAEQPPPHLVDLGNLEPARLVGVQRGPDGDRNGEHFAAAKPCNPGVTQGFELARRGGNSFFLWAIAACEYAQRCVETVAQLGIGVLDFGQGPPAER
jgi:hypothetical protein